MKKPVKHKHKPVTKAKVHRKPVRVTPKIAAARHAAALKAAKTRAANAKKHKARTLALGEGVACCSAEALAASLRLAGAAVSDDDVLALHWLAGGGVDTGVSILAALEAAREFGLAGVRPVRFVAVDIHEREMRDSGSGIQSHHHRRELDTFHLGQINGLDDVAVALLDGHQPPTGPGLDRYGGDVSRGDAPLILVHPLILGLELPGPHAVLAEPGRWWSWGEPYDPASWPDAIIEEAWEVTW